LIKTTHIYRHNGKRLFTKTTIIQSCIFNWTFFAYSC